MDAPSRFPAWPAWIATAALAILAGYLALTINDLEHQLEIREETDAFARLEIRDLGTTLESERIVSMRQTFRLREAEARIAELEARTDPAAFNTAALASLLDHAPDATAVALWRPLSPEGVLIVSRLPAPAPGQDYRLWIIDSQNPTPVDGGSFTVNAATGESRHHFKIAHPINPAARFVVSLEPRGTIPLPTDSVVLASP